MSSIISCCNNAINLHVYLAFTHSSPPPPLFPQKITGSPPEGLTAEEIERERKTLCVSVKFSKLLLNNSSAVSHTYYSHL